MVRNIPRGENPWNINPVLSLSFLIASIAATIGIVSSLCGFLTRKKTQPDHSTDDETKSNENLEIVSPTNEPDDKNNNNNDNDNDNDNEEGVPQMLPPPPGMSNLRAASCHVRSNSNVSTHGKTSQWKLASSMSMKVGGGGLQQLAARQMSKREDNNDKKKDKKLKHDDSIWKKTIILGEKCKVPDEEDEESIVYDEKGKQIPTYHKKTPNSFSLSRQSSAIDPEAISTHHHHHALKSPQS